MTPDQYKAAAQALSDYQYILASCCAFASTAHTKDSKARMKQLAELREALEAEGMK